MYEVTLEAPIMKIEAGRHGRSGAAAAIVKHQCATESDDRRREATDASAMSHHQYKRVMAALRACVIGVESRLSGDAISMSRPAIAQPNEVKSINQRRDDAIAGFSPDVHSAFAPTMGMMASDISRRSMANRLVMA